MPVVISNCSNNYGPNQFPEKLIPLAIQQYQKEQSYTGLRKGENIRDWLYVEDHASAIDVIFHGGRMGETYNIGGNNEWKNIDLIRLLCKSWIRNWTGHQELQKNSSRFVTDRAGHDCGMPLIHPD